MYWRVCLNFTDETKIQLSVANISILSYYFNIHINQTDKMKPENKGEIVIYKAEDGKTAIDVRLQEETIWLTQDQISKLFQRDRSVITKHLSNIFKTSELDEKGNVQKMHIAFSDKPVKYFNLDVIISVGYRVNSKRGTQFRIWATSVLREHLVKGYTANDRRLKELRQTVRLITEYAERRDISINYDKAISNIRRNFRLANQELGQLLPLDKDPISDRQSK